MSRGTFLRAAAAVFLLALTLQSAGARAELSFRTLEPGRGEQRWSAPKAYADGLPSPAEVRIRISGQITRDDLDSARVMMSVLASGRHRLVDNTVWLAGTGGDIDAAMDIGRLLRRMGVFTFVAKDEQCLSACVFAFMGGEKRGVAGQLGIHRPFFPTTEADPNRQVRFRLLQKILRDYIEELDFPPSLYEAVMAVPPESMQLLALAELKRFYLVGMSPSSEDIADAAAARRLGVPMAEYLRRKAKQSP
jgi:hypothetical protein